MKRNLDVWWDNKIVGQLTQNDHGDLGFVYAPAWLADAHTLPLSASLPKREKAFKKRECRPFFAGLLPEENQREVVARVLGVSPANDFSLLDRLGGDVAGAIELLPPGMGPSSSPAKYPPTRLDDVALIKLLDELPLRPLLVGEKGLRLSLAGAQPKVPVVLVDNGVALSAPGQPTTHILKPPLGRFRGTTENEAFVMRLAEAVGLDVAKVEPRVVCGRTFLLIERYDRFVDADGRVQRIHQEDFCQATGVAPENKYASEGGPTFVDCFTLLRKSSAVPGLDVIKLLDAAIFNVIVGNADAHGKNFSILHRSRGRRLAPLYDLLSTAFYPEIAATFAMKIGRRSTLGELDTKGWEQFAKDAGISWPLVRQRVREIAEKIEARIVTVATGIASHDLDRAVVDELATLIGGRVAPCVTSVTK
jgi:serine/threonine-protein kinase HipA